jgi:hypothetical protein
LRRKVIELAERYEAQTILVEEAGPGLTLLQDLRIIILQKELAPSILEGTAEGIAPAAMR